MINLSFSTGIFMALPHMALGTLVLLTVVSSACTESQAVPTQIATQETPQSTQAAPSPTASKNAVLTLDVFPTLAPTPSSTPTATPTVAAISVDGQQAQEILGTVFLVPGVCLPDPADPDLCPNRPVPGRGQFDIREFADAPDVGYSNPIVATLKSSDNGTFRLALPAGEYCVWFGGSCEAKVGIASGLWSEILLQIYLP